MHNQTVYQGTMHELVQNEMFVDAFLDAVRADATKGHMEAFANYTDTELIRIMATASADIRELNGKIAGICALLFHRGCTVVAGGEGA